ncbi:L,D-transpeptidase family protein, partial [Aquipuribacter nitratireducens]
TPEPTPSATPDVTPEPSPSTATSEPVDDGVVRPGDSGDDVLAAQQRFADLGYWLGEVDGSYGPLTTQAVLALQKAAGLQRDGVLGPRTQAALAAGTRPQARGGDGVEIDLDRQLLLVVRGGRVELALNTSTGTGGRWPTPTGRYAVERAIDGMREAPLGDLWRPRYFNRGIAVHGSPSIPAYPASHGCARVSFAAMDMLWARDLMPIGSSVHVY